MALPEETLSIVEQWQKKGFEMSTQSNDTIVSLLSRGIDSMAVVINKKSDINRVRRALASLQSEQSLSLEFDNIRNDEVRSLVYGLIESLHFTLNELTKERNQVKECEEIFTQTEELFDPSLTHSLPSNQMKESAEVFTQTGEESSQPSLENPLHSIDSSHKECDYSHDEPPVNWLEMPKEEVFDESAFKIGDHWGDGMDIKDEEIPNDDEMDALSCMEVSDVEPDFENENANETMNDSNEIMGERKPSDDADAFNADDDIVGDRRDVSKIVYNEGIAQSEVPALNYMVADFDNEDIDETMNGSNDNEIMDGEMEKDLSKTVEVENKSRSSRQVSRPVKSIDCGSLEYSDDDYEPIAKKLKAKSENMKNKKSSTIAKKDVSVSSKGNSNGLKCIECEFQTTSVSSFRRHLNNKHSTTLVLSGLVLRCDCGVETFSENHKCRDTCDIANFKLVRKRGGPIQRFTDAKTTPQCILCEVYPTTAAAYIQHLYVHHKSSLSANGIYLVSSCGAKNRHAHDTKECNRRQYTLHKITDI